MTKITREYLKNISKYQIEITYSSLCLHKMFFFLWQLKHWKMAYFYSIKIWFLLRRKNIVQINYIHEHIILICFDNNISNSNTSWAPDRLLYLLSCRSVKQIDESKYRYRQVHRGLMDYLIVNKLSFKGGQMCDKKYWMQIANEDNFR